MTFATRSSADDRPGVEVRITYVTVILPRLHVAQALTQKKNYEPSSFYNDLL
jgi:hypothetical protein